MKTSLVVVASCLVALSLAIVGCSSGGDSSEGSSGDEQDLTSSSQCTGALPHNCQVCSDGSTQCAHFVITNKKCAIETCPTPPADAECKVATDCKGALPALAQVCPDGKTHGAAFVCNAGKCEVQTCPPECTQPSDCTGPLPALAQVCADGKTHGASHVCKAGKCDIEVCPQ